VTAAYLVKGNDANLRDRVVDRLVAELVGDEDRSLVVEDFTLPGGTGDDDDEARADVVAAVENAVSSPPFMTAHRVVVLRGVGLLKAEIAEPLVRYLDAPLDTTRLVLVAGGGAMPPSLAKKLKAVGCEERAPDSEKTKDVLADAVRNANLRIEPEAAKYVTDHLGDDAGRVNSLVEALRSAYGSEAVLGVDDVMPYLGDAGAVPGYLLTNAIEAGDPAGALEVLHRLLHAPSQRDAKAMHPLQVLAILLGYYRRLLRLDDPSVRTSADAVAALDGRVKEFPARKALDSARSLGTDGIRQAFDALHQADLDLKGARGIPPDAVVEVLVVRLARLARSPGRGNASRRR
jgi:DNA polymerase-3 subunit delta